MTKIRNQSGITLVELLITIIVLSTSLVAIFQFYATSLRSTTKTESRSKSKFLAEQEIERFRALDYNDPELDAFNNFAGKVQFFEDELFVIKSKVTFIDPKTAIAAEPYPVSFEEDTHLKEVIVSVVRKDGIGGQVDLTTYITP